MPGSTRIHIVVPVGTLARVDAVRGDVSRSLWVRRAVERALGGAGDGETLLSGHHVVDELPAPAEQPAAVERASESGMIREEISAYPAPAQESGLGVRAEVWREAGVRSAREFVPYPKRGKK